MKPENNQIDDIKLTFSFTERQLEDLKPGQDITIPLTDDAKAALATAIGEAISPDQPMTLHGKPVEHHQIVEFDFETDDIPEIMAFIEANSKNNLRREFREALRGIGLDI